LTVGFVLVCDASGLWRSELLLVDACVVLSRAVFWFHCSPVFALPSATSATPSQHGESSHIVTKVAHDMIVYETEHCLLRRGRISG
jgi:hypothetical protein